MCKWEWEQTNSDHIVLGSEADEQADHGILEVLEESEAEAAQHGVPEVLEESEAEEHAWAALYVQAAQAEASA